MNNTMRVWAESNGIPLDANGVPDRDECARLGIPLSEAGVPLRMTEPGPAKPCIRCQAPVESPSNVEFQFGGRSWIGPLCDACTDMAFTEAPGFLIEGWNTGTLPSDSSELQPTPPTVE